MKIVGILTTISVASRLFDEGLVVLEDLGGGPGEENGGEELDQSGDLLDTLKK